MPEPRVWSCCSLSDKGITCRAPFPTPLTFVRLRGPWVQRYGPVGRSSMLTQKQQQTWQSLHHIHSLPWLPQNA